MSDRPPSDGAPDAGDVAATFCATLVDEWVRCGLTDAVVAPGSRSTPMALALVRDDRMRVHVFHDERSAAFCALGLGLATGRPALVLCTSGTAAVELHPAVVEAHQAAVPMLAVTADRPPELIGVGAPQTIEQRELYGAAARWYCEPGPPTLDGSVWWRDLARDAWHRTSGTLPGPVHVNLAFREPLIGSPFALPPARDPLPPAVPGARWGLMDEDVARITSAISGRTGVIVAGVRSATGVPKAAADDADAILELAGALGWPILADGPSGVREPSPAVVSTFDAILRSRVFAASHRPEVVIRFGGLLASKVTNQWLASSGAHQIAIDRFGRSPDPDGVVAHSFTSEIAMACDQIVAALPDPAPDSWTHDWQVADASAWRAIITMLSRSGDASEPAVALDVVALVPDEGTVVVSSSMPVRDVEAFAVPREGVRIFSNRGANGIDGVTSTAVGVALSGAPTVLLTGDVAFLHDSNGLIGAGRRDLSMVVVVVDNDGGGIFHFLPQRDELPPEQFETLFGTPHGVDIAATAEALGLPVDRVNTRAGLQAAIAGALTRGGTRVVVVRSDREANVAVHSAISEAVVAAVDGGATSGR